ncbi:hypothetical protein DB032_19520 [Chromobacterium sp. Panama]|uniref:adhesion domain-containing protein n=1 Tax=Chromobacterium sp. Panama TaxID=2161826 RepID=UPI000D305487|nr:DUF823 domain-containing adhesin [Chromobacterium sp. Panama]PTU66956.1 hypothetical protein DB032_19520 [Chromobacterium sp. Panama]
MNKIFQVKWSDVKSGWVVTSELSSRVPSRRRTTRGRGVGQSLFVRISLLGAMVFQALLPAQALAADVVRHVQVRREGVSISQLKWVEVPLEVGQTLSAVYQFHDELNGAEGDQSRYLYGYSDTATQVAMEGLTIEKSGEVPGRLLTEDDVGKTLELSVQGRSRLATGNLQTINTKNLSEGGVAAAIPPRIADLSIQGSLEVGKELKGSYQFVNNGGHRVDASTYAWGAKGRTNPSSGDAVAQSGEVPGHKIAATDAGQVLELAVQARNGAGKTGNTLKVSTDMAVEDGNHTDGGDKGKPIDPSAKPIVKALKVKGTLEVGKDLTGAYQFDANGGEGSDASTFAWGEKGLADAAKGQSVSKSGEVPAHKIDAGDAGKVLEVAVQAKNGANQIGNTAKVATDGTMEGNEGGGNETDGGDKGKPIDPSAKPIVKALKVKGTLEVGKDLTGAYQFDANGGEPTDRSRYSWDSLLGKSTRKSKWSVVETSGKVPEHEIEIGDAGRVLELTIEAMNGKSIVGNQLTVRTDSSASEGNETEGGDNGKPIDPNAAPEVAQLKIIGDAKVGQTLTAKYQYQSHSSLGEDNSRYAWGERDSTSEKVEKGKVVEKSGEVPAYKIQSSDVGRVMEVSVRAENSKGKVGNTATQAMDSAVKPDIETDAPILNVPGIGDFALMSGKDDSKRKNWSGADQMCKASGMRLPSSYDLVALYKQYPNNTINTQYGWPTAYTGGGIVNYWSSTPYSDGGHMLVYLDNGGVIWGNDNSVSRVACVR